MLQIVRKNIELTTKESAQIYSIPNKNTKTPPKIPKADKSKCILFSAKTKILVFASSFVFEHNLSDFTHVEVGYDEENSVFAFSFLRHESNSAYKLLTHKGGRAMQIQCASAITYFSIDPNKIEGVYSAESISDVSGKDDFSENTFLLFTNNEKGKINPALISIKKYSKENILHKSELSVTLCKSPKLNSPSILFPTSFIRQKCMQNFEYLRLAYDKKRKVVAINFAENVSDAPSDYKKLSKTNSLIKFATLNGFYHFFPDIKINGKLKYKGENLRGPIEIEGFGKNVFLVFLETPCETKDVETETVSTMDFTFERLSGQAQQ